MEGHTLKILIIILLCIHIDDNNNNDRMNMNNNTVTRTASPLIHLQVTSTDTNSVTNKYKRLIYTMSVTDMLSGRPTGRSLAYGNWNCQFTGAYRLHDTSY